MVQAQTPTLGENQGRTDRKEEEILLSPALPSKTKASVKATAGPVPHRKSQDVHLHTAYLLSV